MKESAEEEQHFTQIDEEGNAVGDKQEYERMIA